MIKLKNHKLLTCAFLIFVFFTGCEKLQEEYNTPEYNNPMKIGVVGDVSVLREQVENIFFGVQLASEEINNYGGLEINNQNREIELIYKNSAGNPEEGIKVTNELINDGVDIIIGPTFSSVAIEMAELCIQKDVLMMTYSATSPELSLLNDNDLIWRTCPSDYTFGTFSAHYIYNTLQHRRAAILYRHDTFGTGLSDIVKNTFEELGGNVLNNVSFPGDIVDIDSYDFSFELNTLLDKEIDVIYIIAFNSEIAKITNEIYNNDLYQDLTIKPNIVLSDGIIPEELIINGNPELLETVIGITSTNEGNPNYSTYKTNYINRFGFSPATYSEHAYDALYCISYAIQKANSNNPADITSVLREISGIEDANDILSSEQVVINVNEFDIGKNIINKGESINYEGASGQINFDNNGDPLPQFVIWGIEDNEFVEISYYGK
ncbi:MAG: ABC transporter substrate-binding protein [Bacteroidales bacterium]|jgi:ABC-type branched-subunit amino acid transport system substrate-binding protein|nr:ABC transporter substrate-binding protein [Bacteroidales bacterium]